MTIAWIVVLLTLTPQAGAATECSEHDVCPDEQQAPSTLAELAPPPPMDEGASHTLAVGGDATALEHLGPMVLQRDGRSWSRITNWQSMREQEQKKTMRIITKRNRARIKKALDEIEKRGT
jgi:hypothetical protein